jgi:simple sugar transport system permease protein
VFAFLFILVGLYVLFNAPSSIEAETISRMSFGRTKDAPVWEAPTRLVMIVVAIFYVVGGLVSLIDRWPRISFALLLINGVLIFPTILIAAAAGKQTNMLTMLAESLRLATPIVIGATAGIWCERSGVINIAIEGMMLTGAAFGFITFFFLEPLMPDAVHLAMFLGVMAAVLSGAIMSLLHAWLSITFKTDQIVSGTVINILAVGLTSFARREFLLSTRAGRMTLPSIAIPGLVKIPIIGEVLFNNKPIFYMMFILLIATHIILFYTSLGLRMRAVGEHPHAADTVGIRVIFTRYRNVIISGMIAGLGGAWFSLETVGGFDDLMTGGRGFIALAAMIFGKWTPVGAFGGGLLFGFADALGTRFQILNVPVPPQWLQMLPFIMTMVVLAGLIGRAIPPAAVGQPFEKE